MTYSSKCEEGQWTRAVFDMHFDNWPRGVPGPANNWYLDDNVCWPKTLVPGDPGFALNRDDEWYKLPRNANQRAKVAQYKKNPTQEWFQHVDSLLIRPRLKHDKVGNPTAPRKMGPGGGWLRRLRNRQVLQALDDGFAISDANSTRRLTAEEVDQDVEFTDCSEDTCSEEQAELAGETYAVVPPPLRQLAATAPHTVQATVTAFAQVKTLATRIHARMTVSPNLPKHTGSAYLR